MKKNITLFVLLTILTTSFLYAQSDYERLQNFKSKYKQIENDIKYASSLDECSSISDSIAELKDDYYNDKVLLDKALYPENFESSFAKLENTLEGRRSDFSQISDLSIQVDTLTSRLTELSQRNEDMLKQIQALNIKAGKDQKSLAELNNMVLQLKASIRQRDLLVRDFVDSLLTEFINSPGKLTQTEKSQIISKVKNNNLFYNVERAVADNIQFLKVTNMNADDLSEMKEQYSEFHKVWQRIGPKLGSVYLNKKEKKSEIADIDSMLVDWDQKIDHAMWDKVNDAFYAKKIVMPPFYSGEQFVDRVNSYINDEIKNVNVKSDEEAKNDYKAFADTVYFRTIQPTWIPVLVKNNLMTKANQDSIEAKITAWSKVVGPAEPTMIWLYIILGIIVVGAVLFMLLKGKKRTVEDPNLTHPSSQHAHPAQHS